MKSLVLSLSLSTLFLHGLAAAQEKIPPETAAKASKLLMAESAKLDGLPLKTDVDGENPYGVMKNDRGAIVLPDRNLTEQAITKPTKQVQPLGQLWIKGLTPMVDGSAVADDKLLLVNVNGGGEGREIALLLLGVREKDGKAEVVVYSKGKEPLVSLPVESISQGQERPIELEVKNPKEKSGDLTINILGKHQAKLTLKLR